MWYRREPNAAVPGAEVWATDNLYVIYQKDCNGCGSHLSASNRSKTSLLEEEKGQIREQFQIPDHATEMQMGIAYHWHWQKNPD